MTFSLPDEQDPVTVPIENACGTVWMNVSLSNRVAARIQK